MRSLGGSLVLAMLLWSSAAQAGRRPFIWTYDTEIVPRGDLELEQWLWAKTRPPSLPAKRAAYWIWWAPVIGLAPRLELAIPFQVLATAAGTTTLDSFEADVRY